MTDPDLTRVDVHRVGRWTYEVRPTYCGWMTMTGRVLWGRQRAERYAERMRAEAGLLPEALTDADREWLTEHRALAEMRETP